MLLPPTVVWYPALDSTNSYLLRKFESEGPTPSARPNAAFWRAAVAAQTQTAGRGQRQNKWQDKPGESLLLSVAAQPSHALEGQVLFSFGIATAIAQTLERHCPGLEIALKWPNDLMANGRKLGGILIENVLRGVHWQLAVVGVGINLLQKTFPPELLNAVSLLQLTGRQYSARELANELGAAIYRVVTAPPANNILERYNARLFRRGALQEFCTAGKTWTGKVESTSADGRLLVWDISAGEARWCVHGVDIWLM